MKSNSKKYQTTDKSQIITNLHMWLNQENATFFTTCYKARAVGVFVQYETPDKATEPYLYAVDQKTDDVLTYVSGWLNAIFQKETVFKVEEREKVGFSVFITLESRTETQGVEVSEDEVTEMPVPVAIPTKDEILEESEKRTIDEIVVTAISKPISRIMENKQEEENIKGIKRSNLTSIKVQSNVRHIDTKESNQEEKEKQIGRKAEYDWTRLPSLFKEHKGSITQIAKALGCSGPAVRRQIAKLKLK